MPLSPPWPSHQDRVSWSYFQLMHEHRRDFGGGHSCPTWDLPMGTLCLEALHCPAKTFSSCTTVRSDSSLGLLLPTLLAQVSDLQCEPKPPPAYSWFLHFILCSISLNLSLAFLIPFWCLCLRRPELTWKSWRQLSFSPVAITASFWSKPSNNLLGIKF